jgi:hypothetical protein
MNRIQIHQRQALHPKDAAPWMRYAGFVESGDPNSSQSIDEIIYSSEDWLIEFA